jgi:hypothetical protein
MKAKFFFKRKYEIKNFDKHPLKQILYFEDIEKEYNNVLQKWFEDYEQLKHIYEMFFLTTYAKQTLAFSFLSLAQALDSYTEIFIESKCVGTTSILDNIEFKKRKNELLQDIAKSKHTEYKKWLDENLNNNLKGLKYEARIMRLIEDFSFISEIPKIINLVKIIAETRHAISHGDSTEKKKNNPFCYAGYYLEWLFYGTKLIMTAVFLRKIGLNDTKISECLKRDYRYRNILEGKYRFEEKVQTNDN